MIDISCRILFFFTTGINTLGDVISQLVENNNITDVTDTCTQNACGNSGVNDIDEFLEEPQGSGVDG